MPIYIIWHEIGQGYRGRQGVGTRGRGEKVTCVLVLGEPEVVLAIGMSEHLAAVLGVPNYLALVHLSIWHWF